MSGKQLQGYTFLRQRPAGQYIADFLCKELMLIIEVDGITHQFKEVAENDNITQERLESMEFKVVRFQDEEVLNDLSNVQRTLIQAIEYRLEK